MDIRDRHDRNVGRASLSLMTKSTVEHKASRVLLTGIWSSGLLMAAGLILTLAGGLRPEEAPASAKIGDILRFALEKPAHPLTLLYGGILVLMCTPILRVIAALIGFAEERDRRYVLVSATVLFLLLCEVAYSAFLP